MLGKEQRVSKTRIYHSTSQIQSPYHRSPITSSQSNTYPPQVYLFTKKDR